MRDHAGDVPSGPDAPGGRTRAVLQSGRDGKTPPLDLPTPARSLSLTVKKAGDPRPYAQYDAEVLLPGYYPQDYATIPLFDGITSIQRVDMIPLPIGGLPGDAPEDTFVTEGQSPDL